MKVLILIYLFFVLFALGCKPVEELSQAEIQQNQTQPRKKYSTQALKWNGADTTNPILCATMFGGNPSLIDSFSFSVWFKMDSENPSGTFITNELSATNHLEIMWAAGSQLRFIIDVKQFVSGPAIQGQALAEVAQVTEWNHAIFIYDYDEATTGYATLSIYVNGELAVSERFQGLQLALTGASLLRFSRGGSFLSVGYTDEAALWPRILSPAEISDIYNKGMPGDLDFVANDYTAWWRMGETSTAPNLAEETGNNALSVAFGSVFETESAFKALDPFDNDDVLNDGVPNNNVGEGNSGTDPFVGGSNGYNGDLSGDGQATDLFP